MARCITTIPAHTRTSTTKNCDGGLHHTQGRHAGQASCRVGMHRNACSRLADEPRILGGCSALHHLRTPLQKPGGRQHQLRVRHRLPHQLRQGARGGVARPRQLGAHPGRLQGAPGRGQVRQGRGHRQGELPGAASMPGSLELAGGWRGCCLDLPRARPPRCAAQITINRPHKRNAFTPRTGPLPPTCAHLRPPGSTACPVPTPPA